MGLEQAPMVLEELRVTIEEDFVFHFLLKLDNIEFINLDNIESIQNENICIGTSWYFQLFSSKGSTVEIFKYSQIDSNIWENGGIQ